MGDSREPVAHQCFSLSSELCLIFSYFFWYEGFQMESCVSFHWGRLSTMLFSVQLEILFLSIFFYSNVSVKVLSHSSHCGLVELQLRLSWWWRRLQSGQNGQDTEPWIVPNGARQHGSSHSLACVWMGEWEAVIKHFPALWRCWKGLQKCNLFTICETAESNRICDNGATNNFSLQRLHS